MCACPFNPCHKIWKNCVTLASIEGRWTPLALRPLAASRVRATYRRSAACADVPNNPMPLLQGVPLHWSSRLIEGHYRLRRDVQIRQEAFNVEHEAPWPGHNHLPSGGWGHAKNKLCYRCSTLLFVHYPSRWVGVCAPPAKLLRGYNRNAWPINSSTSRPRFHIMAPKNTHPSLCGVSLPVAVR